MWIAQSEPEIFGRTAKFLEAHAFLVEKLTGCYRTSLACADPLGMVDMPAGRWAGELLRELGFREDQFPELDQPGVISGRVHSAAASRTGLAATTWRR